MLIQRTSRLTGRTTTRNIDVTEEQLRAYHNGMLMQYAMPELNEADREFILLGVTQEEWEAELSAV